MAVKGKKGKNIKSRWKKLFAKYSLNVNIWDSSLVKIIEKTIPWRGKG